MDNGIGTPIGVSGDNWDEAIENAEERLSEDIKEAIDERVAEEVGGHCHTCGKSGDHDCEVDPNIPQVPEFTLLSEVLDGLVRKENELYCDYRCRLHWEKYLRKQYLYGRTIWKSRERGEMRNLDRKDRDSKLRRKKDAQKQRVKEIREAQGVRTPQEVKSLNRERKQAFIRACEQ